MNYESWRISFQSSEQAARAAFQQLEASNAERDALAAHVETMTRLWLDMDDCEQGSDEQEELIAQMFDVIRDHHNKTAASLARRDWINKAEALEEMAGKIHRINPAYHLRSAAAIYRKQAEGHQ